MGQCVRHAPADRGKVVARCGEEGGGGRHVAVLHDVQKKRGQCGTGACAGASAYIVVLLSYLSAICRLTRSAYRYLACCCRLRPYAGHGYDQEEMARLLLAKHDWGHQIGYAMGEPQGPNGIPKCCQSRQPEEWGGRVAWGYCWYHH